MTAAAVEPRTAAIVPAAGRGERLGAGSPKALRLLAGVPLLVHATRALAGAQDVGLVVVAAPPDQVGEVDELLADEHGGADLLVVAGGSSRQESVRRALAVVPAGFGQVLVHDAARPLAPVELVDLVTATVRGGAGAVVPGVPMSDTVKRVDDGRVAETLDRTLLRAIQTPQGFRREVLEAAHVAVARGIDAGTDDAVLVERLGVPVVVVPGAGEAFKVTRPIDLLLAEVVLAQRGTSGAG